MTSKHVILNTDKFSFVYVGDTEKRLYYCTPSYENGYVIIMWLGKNGIPEAIIEPINLMFSMINSGRIKVIELIKID